MDILWLEDAPKNFEGYSLVLPSVSLANVGQLAVDVLISTLQAQQVAIVHHPALIPVAGSGAYQSTDTGLTTSADLHVCHQHKLLLLQLRAPHARGRRRELVNSLCQWLADLLTRSSSSESSSPSVIVLASCQAANRTDTQMTGVQLRYYPSKLFHEHDAFDSLKKVGPPQLEEFDDDTGTKVPFLPEAGYVKDVIDTCTVPSVSLLSFVNEGDNTNDALQLAAYFYAWHSSHLRQVDPKSDIAQEISWKMPPSWKNMFGAPAPRSIFL